jgi:DNA mismatch repair protein MutS
LPETQFIIISMSPKLITRYQELKKQASDCLLLMQVGAFMKVFNDDAQVVSEITDIKLQLAGEVNAPVVHGGFPKSAIDKYVGQLVLAGYSVAIALQDETIERHIEKVIRVQIEKPNKI